MINAPDFVFETMADACGVVQARKGSVLADSIFRTRQMETKIELFHINAGDAGCLVPRSSLRFAHFSAM